MNGHRAKSHKATHYCVTSNIHIALDIKAAKKSPYGGVMFFSVLFACFNFLDLTHPSIFLITPYSIASHYPSLSFVVLLRQVVTVCSCDRIQYPLQRAQQTDLFLYGDLLTAERQKLFFFFIAPLTLTINIHFTHTQTCRIHTEADIHT